jgi:hypothetical protein
MTHFFHPRKILSFFFIIKKINYALILFLSLCYNTYVEQNITNNRDEEKITCQNVVVHAAMMEFY